MFAHFGTGGAHGRISYKQFAREFGAESGGGGGGGAEPNRWQCREIRQGCTISLSSGPSPGVGGGGAQPKRRQCR